MKLSAEDVIRARKILQKYLHNAKAHKKINAVAETEFLIQVFDGLTGGAK